MTQIDQAVDIREGEELDIAAVDRFMKQAIPDLEGAPAIKQYPGGASNLTYQVDYGDRSYVLRRPPFGHIAKSAHDMLREAKVMRLSSPNSRMFRTLSPSATTTTFWLRFLHHGAPERHHPAPGFPQGL